MTGTTKTSSSQKLPRSRSGSFALSIGLCVACAWLVYAGRVFAQVEPATSGAINFNRDIRPILSQKCFACHGPDESQRKGSGKGLRLDTRDGQRTDLGNGAAVVPGKPEASALLARLVAADEDDRMPPPKTGKSVDARELDLLRRWIASGAVVPSHWAYAKPTRPAAPHVRQSEWISNPIDRFILTRLEEAGLAPQPRAALEVLLRRAAFDLTGLPPAGEKVRELTRLKGSALEVYERWVDSLLASPSYGEHWARLWLDLARYADSAGYADDPPRTIWAYRDYVIRAFNRNLPFDQFTVEQLAGDLLDHPTEEQLMATAFHRNTMTNNEGGTADEEFRAAAIVDRVNTTFAVWMGTSMACAQCHTHKYDPITQKEYFQLYDFFNHTADADRPDESPVLEFYSRELRQRQERLKAEIAELNQQFSSRQSELTAEAFVWAKPLLAAIDWEPLNLVSFTAESGAEIRALEDRSLLVKPAAAPRKQETYTVQWRADSDQKVSGIRLEALADEALGNNGPGLTGNFLLRRLRARSLPATEGGVAQEVEFSDASASFSQPSFDVLHVIGDAARAKAPSRIRSTARGTDKGWAVGGALGTNHVLDLVFAKPLQLKAGSAIELKLEQQSEIEQQFLGRFRVSVTRGSRLAEWTAAPASIQAAIRHAPGSQTASSADAIAAYFTRWVAPTLKAERERLAASQQQWDDLKPHTVPILRELDGKEKRKTLMQLRGNYLVTGDEVQAGVPAAWPALLQGDPRNRLALARWLVDPDNPLTSRVLANRYWEQIFGIGLVRTSEEFGSQGDLPSHPELLDWLACELRDGGWDLKRFLKTLVTSSAYCQLSRVTLQALELDPENRLISRAPRFRFGAETVRDQALAAAGLLSHKLYGPSTRPMRPSLGLNAAFGGNLDWQPSAGEDQYRRGLYTEWRRTSPYPSMATFDAPSREVCTLRRNRSNTPLQALVTLNDPVFVEAARGLARRMQETGQGATRRVREGFHIALAREPAAAEIRLMTQLADAALWRYRRDPLNAAAFAGFPEGPLPLDTAAPDLAAWATVASVILNLDETLMRR